METKQKFAALMVVLALATAQSASAKLWAGKDGKWYESWGECSKNGANEACTTNERKVKKSNATPSGTRIKSGSANDLTIPETELKYCSGSGSGKLTCYGTGLRCATYHNDCRGLNI